MLKQRVALHFMLQKYILNEMLKSMQSIETPKKTQHLYPTYSKWLDIL